MIVLSDDIRLSTNFQSTSLFNNETCFWQFGIRQQHATFALMYENMFFHSHVKMGLVLLKRHKMHVSEGHVSRENAESGDILRQNVRKKSFLKGKTNGIHRSQVTVENCCCD